MKPLFMTTAAGALLLSAGCAVTNAGSPQMNNPGQVKANVEMSQVKQREEHVQHLPEFEVIDEQVDADNFEVEIVENNQHTRVIIVTVQESHEKYKSVYVKDTNVLKIIDLNQGLVFQGMIEG